MKKIFLLLAAVLAVTSVSAVPLFSNDRGKIEAALKKNPAPYRKLAYLVRLAEFDDPEASKTFDGYMDLIDRVGVENNFPESQITDAKMFLPFLRKQYCDQAYRLSRTLKHPYELRYMITPGIAEKAVNRIYRTPAARYKAALALLKRHIRTVNAWFAPALSRQIVTYICTNGKAGKVATFNNDMQALKKQIATDKRLNPKCFTGVAAIIDKYAGAAAVNAGKAAPATSNPFFSNDRAFIEKKLSGKPVPFQRIAYLVRLAELDDPEASKTFDGYMDLIDRVGIENNFPEAQITDAKMFLPFLRKQYCDQAYRLSRTLKHPYELRYMTTPGVADESVNSIYRTPAARYKAALTLFKRHIRTVNAWFAPSLSRQIVTYICTNGKAGKVASFNKDMLTLKKQIATDKRLNPKCFAGVATIIDKNVGAAASAPEYASISVQWNFIRSEIKKASQKDPRLLRDYAYFTEFCEKKALEHKLQDKVLADAKCAVPYFYKTAMFKDAMIYVAKVEHPYEIRYLSLKSKSRDVASLYSSPRARYDRALYLLKKHTSLYSDWSSPAILLEAVEFLKTNADADPGINLAEDCNQLKLIFAPYAAKNPKTWKPVLARLTEYTL